MKSRGQAADHPAALLPWLSPSPAAVTQLFLANGQPTLVLQFAHREVAKASSKSICLFSQAPAPSAIQRCPAAPPAKGSLDLSVHISRCTHLGPPTAHTQLPWAPQESKPAAAPSCHPPHWEMCSRARQRFGFQKVDQLLWHCGSCRDSTDFPKLCLC